MALAKLAAAIALTTVALILVLSAYVVVDGFIENMKSQTQKALYDVDQIFDQIKALVAITFILLALACVMCAMIYACTT